MNVTDNGLVFEVKELKVIIKEIEEARNFFKNFISIYRKSKNPIYKSWIEDINNWSEKSDTNFPNYIIYRLNTIISNTYLPEILKIDCLISYFINFQDKIVSDIDKFNQFIKTYCKSFNKLKSNSHEIRSKYDNFSA